MATDLFGFQAGRRMADLDNAALRKAALDERAAELDIKKAEVQLAQNEAFAEAMNDPRLFSEVADERDVPDVLSRIGDVALRTGNIEKGKELLAAASTIANQHSLMKRREAKSAYENLQTLSNLYAGVTNAREWDQANAMYSVVTGQESPFAGQPYSRPLLEQAIAATTSQKDQAAVALSAARRELVDAQIKETELNQRRIDAQTEYTRQRTENLRKVGGKPVPSTYITAVTNRLKNEFADIGEGDSGRVRDQALPLAEEVYGLVMSDGLSLSQAVNQVVNRAIEEGEIGGWPVRQHRRPGSRRDNPAPLPVTKDGTVDTSQMKPNHYYVIPATDVSESIVILRTRAGKNIRITPDMLAEEDEDEELEWDDEDEDEDEEDY